MILSLTEAPVESTAWLSDDEVYRYRLTRTWDRSLPLLLFIMLNPSKADAFIDDQTISRCMHYARRDGYGGIIVVNLYAYRTFSPALLKKAARDGVDIVGIDNECAIRDALNESWDVVVAWGGAHKPWIDRRERELISILKAKGIQPKCLGHTQDASPRHPSRLGNDVPLVPWLVTA